MPLTAPDFLIIGAPKCGTTSLSNALSRHPEIYIPPIKEIGFFSNDKNWQKGREWYASCFEEAEPNAVIGEASPQYLRAQEVPGRIAQTCPKARFVALVRNPVERARSHYWFRCWHGTESRSLRMAFEEELGRFPAWSENDYLLPPGCYVKHLNRYVERFGRDRLFVLALRKLSSSPQDALDEVQRFLGTPSYPLSLSKANRSRAPRSRTYRNFVQYWVKSQGVTKRLLKQVTTQSSRRWLKDLTHSVNMKDKKKPPIPEDIKRRLEELYRPRKKRLREKFGIKV